MADLDDTSNCQLARECDACHSDEDLELATITTPLGVACITACDHCLDVGLLPKFSWQEAAERVAGHAQHLGLTIDEVADLAQPGSSDGGLTL